jgi:hypothetical protein
LAGKYLREREKREQIESKERKRNYKGENEFKRVKYSQKRAKIKSKTMREEYTTAFYGS